MCFLKTSPLRTQRSVKDRLDESESRERDWFYLLTEVRRVWWRDVASTFFRTRPSERFSATNTTRKTVSAPSGANSPFSRELHRVIRGRREMPGKGPRARQIERPDDFESPLDPRLVVMATITYFVMMGCGRRAGTSRK